MESKRNLKSNSKNNSINQIDDIDLESSRNDAKKILDAINEGKLNLSPEEEKVILEDIQFLFNDFKITQNSESEFDFQEEDSVLVDEENNEITDIESTCKYDVVDDTIFKDEAERIFSALNNKSNNLNNDEIKLINQIRPSMDPNVSFDNKLAVKGADSSNDSSSNAYSQDEFIPIDSSENSVNDVVDGSVDESFVEDSDVVDGSVDESFVEDSDVVDGSVEDISENTPIDNSEEIAIKVENLTMEYKIVKEKIDTIKEFVIRSIKRNKPSSKKFVALKNISFEIPKGERVGIIGFNGAGKSTLLKVLSGVYYPTEGSITTNGKIAPLLELGAGFDSNYSGKANIFLNGAFLGFSEDFLKEKYDEIVEFSELGESINYPVKNYSSGMRAKLGFSIATLVNPDILIIDEILSVGDIKFQKKSAEKLRSLIDSGITVLLVSHSVAQIRDICNTAIWMDKGEIVMIGEVNEVCDAYVKAANDATDEQLKNIRLH